MTDSIVQPLRFYQIVLLIVLTALCYFLVKDQMSRKAILYRSGIYALYKEKEFKQKYPIDR